MSGPSYTVSPEALQAIARQFTGLSEVEKLSAENEHLRARLASLEALTTVGQSIGELADLARRYLPREHHDIALQLMRLAHVRGYVECAEAHPAPPPTIVIPREQAEKFLQRAKEAP